MQRSSWATSAAIMERVGFESTASSRSKLWAQEQGTILVCKRVLKAMNSKLRRCEYSSREMYLVLVMTVALSFQISTFSAACSQLYQGHQYEDSSYTDSLHNLQDTGPSGLPAPLANAATATAATTTTTTTTTESTATTLSASSAAAAEAAAEAAAATAATQPAAGRNGTQRARSAGGRISPADIHNFRLEYNKYRILSHLSITGNLDERSPDIDANLRDRLITTTAFSDQQQASSSGVKSDKDACCLENFYVNFTHIGWDKWILYPPGYNANYCRGQCDLSHARYYHSTLLSKYSNLISLCCSPKQMAPLKLLYIDEDNKVHQKSIPDMIVESCDCA